MSGSGQSIAPRIQSSGNSSTCLQFVVPIYSVVLTSVPIHRITQLGLRVHPTGLSAHETITMTFSFCGSDKPVYTTASIKPVGPWSPAYAVAGPIFSYCWNLYPAILLLIANLLLVFLC